jgi:hypothetical protein
MTGSTGMGLQRAPGVLQLKGVMAQVEPLQGLLAQPHPVQIVLHRSSGLPIGPSQYALHCSWPDVS